MTFGTRVALLPAAASRVKTRYRGRQPPKEPPRHGTPRGISCSPIGGSSGGLQRGRIVCLGYG